MKRESMKLRARVKLMAGVFALAIAAVSHANPTTLVGGGSTLVAIGYVGGGAETNVQVFPAGGGSLGFVYSVQRGNPTISYCQTGDRIGKNIFDGPAGGVQNPCPVGFGANIPGVGRGGLQWPNFAAVESPLSQGDLNAYGASHPAGLPVEFPAVAGAIAISLNLASVQGVVLNDTNTNFSDAQLCLIFSGQVVNWTDSRLASAFTLGAGDSIPATPIKVQYESEGSGTTFGFMNHLSAVCPGTPAQHFITDQQFANAVALYLPALPADWTGSLGDPAVAQAIQKTNGSIGYVGTANALAQGIGFAKVKGQDPVANFGARVVIANNTIVYNVAINGTNPNTGRPVLVPIAPAPATKCIAVVNPNSYANPAGGYSIFAVSYLLSNAQGNGADLINTRAWISAPYNPAIIGSSALLRFGPNTGLALLNTGGAINVAIVNACLVN